MTYWICVTNQENWNVVREQKVWGVPARNKHLMAKVEGGDHLVFYVIPQRIVGILTATSKPFESHLTIFKTGEFGREETFPHRIRLEPFIMAKASFQLKELVPELGFITNKKKWIWHLRKPMRMISKEDYDLIQSKLLEIRHRGSENLA